MQVKIFSEDTPQGLTADWPQVPRQGETVSFTGPGGTTNLIVDDVRWYAGSDGSFVSVEIRLEYDRNRKSHGEPMPITFS